MSRAILRLAAVAALPLVWALLPAPASADDRAKDETPSEKARKALDQPIDLDLKETSLAKVVERFREKAKLDITIDRTPVLLGLTPIDPNAEMPQPIEAKFKGKKVRDALRKVFEPFGLAPFVVDDAVLLTGEDTGIARQLKQRVDVDVDDVPLAQALKQLGRRKAMNLVVDQKAAKQGEKKVSLQVEDVPLETAVRLLAEQGGLKAARIDGVLYVTTPEQAASIAAENRANTPPYPPYGPYGPNGMLIGVPGGVGLVGALGAFGVAGGGGLGGGVGGGPPRLLPPPPVPPEVPKLAPPADPPKPSGRAPATVPAVAAHGGPPDVPPVERPALWAREAGRSTEGVRRGRRRAPPRSDDSADL
jgi:hypothetical protein